MGNLDRTNTPQLNSFEWKRNSSRFDENLDVYRLEVVTIETESTEISNPLWDVVDASVCCPKNVQNLIFHIMTAIFRGLNLMKWFLLGILANSSTGYLTKPAIQSRSTRLSSQINMALKAYDTSSTLDDIKDDVERYILTRNAATDAESLSTITSKDYEKFENPLEMFKPTGWYKDEVTIELATRSDRTIPKITHPLAFAELQRYGFQNLSIPIMSLGGPHEVGIRLQLGWVEPIVEKEIYDDEKKILITTTYLMDTRGSLVLGGAMNDMMEAGASELDLNALKEAIQTKKDLEIPDNGKLGDLFKRDADGQINYRQSNNPMKKKSSYVITETKIPKSERFTLSGTQRFYFVLSSFSTAFAHGRASQELLISGPKLLGLDASTFSISIEIADIISNILIIFAVVSCSYSFKTAGLKNRNRLVWSVKGLLGGPLSAIQLRDLDDLEQSL